MDWTAVFNAMKPILAQGLRDGLRIVGMGLTTHGYITNGAGTEAFIGAGMTLAGLFWGWFTTVGYLKVGALLQKMTASRTSADAVKAAQILPPAAAVDTAAKSATAQSVAAKVAVVALLLTGMLAFSGDARAQTKPRLTGNLVNDIAAAAAPKSDLGTNQPLIKLTGNIEQDAQALWKKIQGLTKADLAYAIAKAKAANTNGATVRLQCLQAISDANDQANGDNLKNPDGTPMVRPDPALATNVEDVAELVDNLSPQGKLFTSCAGAANLFKTNILAVINAVVTGAAGIAALPVGL